MVYFFDVEKCRCCPYRAGCYKEGAKKKTYSEALICDAHSEQARFQETEYFKKKAKERTACSVRWGLNICHSYKKYLMVFFSALGGWCG